MRWIFTIFAAVLAMTAPASSKEYVDLELVIATDVSRSIDSDEARLQRRGIAAAFRSKQVIDAIESGVLQRIAVADATDGQCPIGLKRIVPLDNDQHSS